jgi:drug/metabolite transporter (DMT)-like permease
MSSPPSLPVQSASPDVPFVAAQTSVPQAANIKLGAIWMCGATFLWMAQDMVSRILLKSFPLFEVAFARFLVQAILVTLFVLWHRPTAMKARRPGLQMLRSCLLWGVTALSMASLKNLPFVDYVAVVWTAPVLITAFSVWVLNEKVGLRGWLSVLIGMSGAMIIINPLGVSFRLEMFLPLAAAICSAFYQITTRMLQFSDSGLTTFFYTALVGAAACGLFMPFIGLMPGLTDMALMLVIGLTGLTSHFCLIRALSLAPANTMAPLGYTALVWATLASLTVFAEIPSLQTLVGTALIVTAGLGAFSHKAEA